jgi:aldehyde:ferredoxin oxidoreductase
MLGIAPEEDSFAAKVALWREVNRRLILPVEQMGCDIIDVGVGLAALFEGLDRGIIPAGDVPRALTGGAGLEAAVAAVERLRHGVDAARYPALRAVGDGPQALAERYPAMQEIVYTCGARTMGNAGHSNALWTFLMPFSRFFSHYAGQIYKIDVPLPSQPTDEELRRVFQQVVARMFEREAIGILCNALSCCAFTFVIYTQDGEGERLDEDDLLVRTMAQYGLRVTRQDLLWFAQAFWAQSIDLKAQHGWRPPGAQDLPRRVYEGLSLVLDRPLEELVRWMEMLIEAWRSAARAMLDRYGYETTWLEQT